MLALGMHLLMGIPALLADDPREKPGLPGRDKDNPRQAEFPTRFELDDKWGKFQSQPLTATGVLDLLKEDSCGAQLVRWGEARYTSLWVAVDRRVGKEKNTVAGLGDACDDEARAMLRTAASLDDVLSVARRFPWSSSVQRALLETGELELRQGHLGFARRCFEDVLKRSFSADLRDRAQVGIWLAVAHQPHVLEAAFQGIDLQTRYPWMGDMVAAGVIRQRLQAERTAPSQVVDLKTLEQRLLTIPASSGEIGDQPGIGEDGLAVAGPATLAWFGGRATKPTWLHLFPVTPSKGPIVPGPFIPAMGSGRVYARWGVQAVAIPSGNVHHLVDVAAFDMRSGVPIWSTAGNPDWQDLCPINDPVSAEGRVYLLAALKAQEYSPLFLVCLDAESGAVLWKRGLVSNHTLTKSRTDVVHQGNSVTVVDGSVYCLTNVGAAARCDARDGLIEWVRSYPQDERAKAPPRPGAAPLVVGQQCLFLPRDSSGSFALDKDSGELAWSRGDETAERFLGSWDNRAILTDTRRVYAIDSASGKVQAEHAFSENIERTK
jgi:outer membrane protein assembly factor BamB